ncbi:MAG: UDP-N-acetylglucosamine 2-epimerase (non-hydrolyzing), partial [Clostridia bacterium]|nr:UDP-N-acetylglucosamine 2-epimerase (non-hydrolyzing) [Clostridia bacterium]
MPVRVLCVFGTRPEAIKMAPVVRALREAGGIEPAVLVTAQHREMLDQVLDHFGIHPDYDLNVMRPRQSLSDLTARVLRGTVAVLRRHRPDLVLVHGDTTTTLAAALAAFYEKRLLGHVEAGLRTRQKYAPFPEEMNRHLTGVLADLHFAPTARARSNLLAEGVSDEAIFVTGNTAIDALIQTVRAGRPFASPVLSDLARRPGRLLLVEAHRRENWGRPLEQACRALREVVERHRDVYLVYSVHRNPQVSRVVERVLGSHDRVVLLEPVPYPDWCNLLQRAYLVVTDSGGLQEEAPSLGKPVVLLRETTERPEALEAGTVVQVGTDPDHIAAVLDRLLTDPLAYEAMARAVNP